MKVYINKDELYPFFFLDLEKDARNKEFKIDKRRYERWVKIMKDFEDVQHEMKEVYRR